MQFVGVVLIATLSLGACFQRGPRHDKDDDATSASLGSEVPLGEKGFERVRASGDAHEMKLFVKRLLSAEDRSATNRSMLKEIAHEFVDKDEAKTLADLKRSLRNANGITDGVGRTAPLSQEGLEQVRSEKGGAQMKAYVRRLVAAQGNQVDDEDAFAFFARTASNMHEVHFKGLSAATKDAAWVTPTSNWIAGHASGAIAPLNDDGYQAVAKLHSDAEMKTFIERVLWSDAYFVQNETGLEGIVGHFSGTNETKDFRRLKRTLQNPKHAWWIGEGLGRTAELSEFGYQEVAEQRNNMLMKAFLRRVADSAGVQVDEATLSGMAPFFSGKSGAESLQAAKEAVLRIGSPSELEAKDDSDMGV